MKSLLRLAILILSVAMAHATPQKVSKDLGGKDPKDMVDVIVQFKKVPTEAQYAKCKNKGGKLKTKLHLVKGGLISIPAGALNDLADDPDVAYISPNRRVEGSLDYAAPAINATIAWNYGWDGSGIGVAVIDSGITTHQDLMGSGSKKASRVSRIVYRENFVDLSMGADDLYGHGTHVAGIVAGNGTGSSCATCTAKFSGIAWNANLIDLRVLDHNGSGTDSAVIAAIQQAITLKTTYNIRIINLSLGRPVSESYTQDPLCQAVEAAWNAGIVVVVAAGNDGRDNSQGTNGYATINSPGNHPSVITVGAMKTGSTPLPADVLIASYSSKGPTLLDHVVKPDLVAPGNRIISVASSGQLSRLYPENLIPVGYYDSASLGQTPSTYFRLSGTSMATPMVSGAAALLLQKEPSLTPDQVKARLMKTASKIYPISSTAADVVTGATYTTQYDIFTMGAGYLDVWAALSNSDVATGTAHSPTAVYDSATGTVSMMTDPSAVWGGSVLWGTSLVWGSNLFVSGTSVLWGSSVVWGTNMTQGFSVIWGTNVGWQPQENLTLCIRGEN